MNSIPLSNNINMGNGAQSLHTDVKKKKVVWLMIIGLYVGSLTKATKKVTDERRLKK